MDKPPVMGKGRIHPCQEIQERNVRKSVPAGGINAMPKNPEHNTNVMMDVARRASVAVGGAKPMDFVNTMKPKGRRW